MSTANYRIHEKKCATCSYWAGTREIIMQNYKPFYIKATAGQFQCMVQNRLTSAVTFCNRWRMWEKID